MGDRLVKFFNDAKARSGMLGQVKLAMMTKMSVEQAQAAPDSPENIKIFEDAIATLAK